MALTPGVRSEATETAPDGRGRAQRRAQWEAGR
jgi:hypothetical protein